MFQLPEAFPLTLTSSKGNYLELYSPNDGSLITRVQEASEQDIDWILASRKEAQEEMKKLRPYERSSILKKVAQDLSSRKDFLAWLISTEGGKPIRDARIEVTRAVATLELCAEETLRLQGEVIPMERTPAGKDHLAFTQREPIGAVLGISAFNHPLNLIAHQAGCALASGCSVVIKPAPQTPLSAYFMAQAFEKAGLPSSCLVVVVAQIPLVEKLLSSSAFDFVSFIGSSKVGWEIRKKIAPGTRLSLEHGGVAAAIVREDADIEQACAALVKGAFYHAGQVCISTQVIHVHHSQFKNFLSQFVPLTQKLKTGPATDQETDVGPLIRPAEVKRLKEWITEATGLGAHLELGGEVSGNLGQFLSPTILRDVPKNSLLMTEEAFGPVVCINSFEDEESLLNELNQKRFIFEGALFTRDLSRAFQMAQKLSSMTLVINNHTAFRVDQMPFGGHKESGLGMGGVRYAIEELTRLKQIVIKI